LSFNRYYLLLALAILILAGAYLGYRWREQQLFSSVWAFIPQSAVLVVESTHPTDRFARLAGKPAGRAARKRPTCCNLPG
jgi:hypothetical protein